MFDQFPAALRARVEQAAAPGDWITVDQARIDAFAACTGDTYWIHTDPERARRETPFGGSIAHGFLLLSLIAGPGSLHLGPLPGVANALNYGLERVRFLTPVPAGAQVTVPASVTPFGKVSLTLTWVAFAAPVLPTVTV